MRLCCWHVLTKTEADAVKLCTNLAVMCVELHAKFQLSSFSSSGVIHGSVYSPGPSALFFGVLNEFAGEQVHALQSHACLVLAEHRGYHHVQAHNGSFHTGGLVYRECVYLSSLLGPEANRLPVGLLRLHRTVAANELFRTVPASWL